MKAEKIKYDDPELLIILLGDRDVISTSGEQGSLGGWNGENDVDAGGWT